MSNDGKAEDGAEIELAEIIAMMKPAIPLTVIIGILCGAAGIAYALTLDKEYQAVAKFTIDSGDGGALGGLGGAIPDFARSSESGEKALASDKITSRDFIIALFDKTEIDTDPYFTKEDQKPGPIGLAMESVFGSTEKTPAEREARIVQTFRQVVGVDPSDNGIISVRVTHKDPVVAADLANTIVDTHIANIELKRIQSGQKQVDLTKQRLSLAKADLDDALKAARLYAVENNIRSEEDLGASSLNLTRFRRELTGLDAVIPALTYLEGIKRSSPSQTIDADNFFDLYPAAFTQLQQNFGWGIADGSLEVPDYERLTGFKKSLIEKRSQLARTLRVIEADADQNAEAAGRLAELNRSVAVNEAIYGRLVTQFEARDQSAELLKQQKMERIQEAVPPIKASSPQVLKLGLMTAILGSLAALGLKFLRILRAGTLHTANRLARAFGTPPLAENIGRTLGRGSKPVPKLQKQAEQLSNIGLADLTINLRDPGNKTIMLLGVPRTPVMDNLAVVLGSGIADGAESVAILDLAKSSRGGPDSSIRSHGAFSDGKKTGRITQFKWIENSTGGKNTMPLDKAIEQITGTYDRVVIASAPMRQGVMRNKIAIEKADRILVLASKGKTTQENVKWTKKLISQAPNTEIGLLVS